MKSFSKISLAHLPTPIEKLRGDYEGHTLYLKRDDLTGAELSGNKVRKLEYVVKDALIQGADVLITCGGIQSNHARATAVSAVKAGLKAHLVLRSDIPIKTEGNVLLNKLYGAEISVITADAFKNIQAVMKEIAEDYARIGLKAYIIPVGASMAIGNLGYVNAFYEILQDEKRLGLNFDTIVCTVGSGGTYSGLWLGNYLSGAKKHIVGINISNDADYFKKVIADITSQTLTLLGEPTAFKKDEFTIIDGYAGRGYGLSTDQELAFIKNTVKITGVLFDPVYTGKAYRGLIETLKRQPNKIVSNKSSNILFIHTGGLFAIFSRADEMVY